MPRSNLKALRKPVSKYNNSSPRYTRENLYTILAQTEISYVSNSQDTHNASYYPKCRGLTHVIPSVKLQKVNEVNKYLCLIT